jgi:hypothetical protein
MAIGRANGLPKYSMSPSLSKRDLETAKVNNQFVVSGNAPSFPGNLTSANSRIIVFLESYFATNIGNILDGDNTPIISNIPANTLIEYGFSPIRIEGGVRFSGNGVIAKGFFIEVGYDMDQGVTVQ